MKIFIDTTTWARVAEERESPFYMGENNVSKIRVYFNTAPTDWYPTLKFVKSNNRRVGPITYDVNGYGSETVYNLEGYERANWYFFDFTISAWKGVLDVSGELQITLIINHVVNNTINSQHLVNFKNNVVKTTVYGEDENIIVLGDDP